MTPDSTPLSLTLQSQTRDHRERTEHSTTARFALTMVLLASAAGCASRPAGPDGGAAPDGGATPDAGASVTCDPLAPSACAQGQGCYFDEEGLDFVCAKAGSAAVGGTCTQDTDCAPKLGCQFPGSTNFGICKPFCSVKTSSGCSSPDICFDTGEGTVGICQPCPQELQCGSACCQDGDTCNAGVCTPPVSCDPLTQNCTTAGQACYVDPDGIRFICTASTGAVADGKACDFDTDCLKFSGCYYASDTASSGVCTHYCKPGTSPTTCKSGQTCDDVGDGILGYCK